MHLTKTRDVIYSSSPLLFSSITIITYHYYYSRLVQVLFPFFSSLYADVINNIFIVTAVVYLFRFRSTGIIMRSTRLLTNICTHIRLVNLFPGVRRASPTILIVLAISLLEMFTRH